MFKGIIRKMFKTKFEREVIRLSPIVDEINRNYEAFRALSDEEILAKTEDFKKRAADGESLDDMLPEAYGLVKEVCRRLCGKTITVTGHEVLWEMIPYDVQLIGAIVLHQGKIAEMATGEGKTLVATMPLYLNALTGKGTHLVTVNDYLAKRDSEWMGPVYQLLGLTVGCIQHDIRTEERKAAYQCDITYGTNNEFGFDYLRDNMAVRLEDRVQRGHHYAIVDEVDSVLIDEARTPLIISGPVGESTQKYKEYKQTVESLVGAQVRLVNKILAEAQELMEQEDKEYEAGIKLFQAYRGMPKNKKLIKILGKPGMKKLLQRIEADFMREKKVHELDEELYFAMDEKGHNIALTDIGREKLSPRDPNLFVIPDLSVSFGEIDGREDLTREEKAREKLKLEREYSEKSERIHNIHQLLKAYVLFEKDVEYVLQDGKVMIVDEFTGRLMPGRRFSDGLHMALEAKEGVKIEGETQTLATITLQNYFRLYQKLAGMTGTAETEENEFWDIYKLEVVVIPTNRPVRRIDYDDEIYKTKREKYKAIIDEIEKAHDQGRPVLVGTISVDVSETLSRMLKRRAIKHHVLNAKYHQQEAEIIARAGEPGAVTIATNMAGRGTDIKLGPGVVRCSNCLLLHQEDPMAGEPVGDNLPEGYTGELDCRAEMPCGLYVIATERHEARRIDRQLRGRCARQGDAGASKFYLSLEDDLMRLFGSDRIAGIMDKLGAEEGERITHPLVTRSIQKAQQRVEAHNFEIRKHLLEYDDVMNQQREVIYDLRLRIQEGHDLEGHLKEMVEGSVRKKLEDHVDPKAHPEEWDIKGLAEDIMLSYLIRLPIERWMDEDIRFDDIEENTLRIANEAIDERLKLIDEDRRSFLLQRILLAVIDDKWKDHLYDLDHLKSGIGFRAYGQKDPLLEYKQEAYDMFVDLLDNINHEVTSIFFKAPIMTAAPVGERAPVRGVEVSRAPVSAFDSARAATAGQSAMEAGVPIAASPGAVGEGRQQEPSREPVRVGPKVGRNQPCPCGSGKKYKKCCGR
ncbi:MAG: preprotein translocase subunit SecA [Candidatus Glassbacteria bacterium]